MKKVKNSGEIISAANQLIELRMSLSQHRSQLNSLHKKYRALVRAAGDREHERNEVIWGMPSWIGQLKIARRKEILTRCFGLKVRLRSSSRKKENWIRRLRIVQ